MRSSTQHCLSLLQACKGGLSTLELRAAGVNHPAGRVLELRDQFNIDSVQIEDIDQAGIYRKVSKYFYRGQK